MTDNLPIPWSLSLCMYSGTLFQHPQPSPQADMSHFSPAFSITIGLDPGNLRKGHDFIASQHPSTALMVLHLSKLTTRMSSGYQHSSFTAWILNGIGARTQKVSAYQRKSFFQKGCAHLEADKVKQRNHLCPLRNKHSHLR